MITPKITDSKVVFGPCRLSYTHVFEKHSFDGNPENGKYSTNILIPKTEKETIKAINEAIEAAKKAAIASKSNGKCPKDLTSPLMDGDDKDDEVYAGHYYLNAKCNTRPGLVNRDRTPLVDEEELYSGVWAIVSVTFFGYNVNVKKGISCGLNNLMKFKDDEKLGGRTSAENDFADINDFGAIDDDDL